MLLDYIKERYGNVLNYDEDLLNAVLAKYTLDLQERQAKAYTSPYGFFLYSLQGDAMIVWDLYTTPAARKKKKAWELFNKILEINKNAGKRVIIGFSDKIGQNHADGIGAMLAAGFTKAQETSDSFIFIRGT
jgi:hypothetical protein